MAQTGVNYPGADLINSPTFVQAPLTIGNAGGSLVLQPGVSFSQQGSTATPVTPSAGAVSQYTTALGQPGYVNPQGLQVLDSGVIAGSVLVAPKAVTPSTAETTLITGALPANDPQAGGVYLIRAGGIFSTTGTPTLTFTLRYGGIAGTSMAAIPATASASSVTNCLWDVEAIFQVYTTTTAVGLIRAGIGTSASTDAATFYVNSPTAAVTIASTTASNLVLDFAWGTSSASNTLSALTGYAMRLA